MDNMVTEITKPQDLQKQKKDAFIKLLIWLFVMLGFFITSKVLDKRLSIYPMAFACICTLAVAQHIVRYVRFYGAWPANQAAYEALKTLPAQFALFSSIFIYAKQESILVDFIAVSSDQVLIVYNSKKIKTNQIQNVINALETKGVNGTIAIYDIFHYADAIASISHSASFSQANVDAVLNARA